MDNYDPCLFKNILSLRIQIQVEWEAVQQNNQRNSGRLPKRNILQNKPGLRNAARSIADLIESFSLFITDSLIDSIVKFTNNRTSTFHKPFPELAQVAANRLIVLNELKVYFRILYLRAALKQNQRDSVFQYSIWYHESSCSVFTTTMSLNRFSFITGFLQFDGRSSREECKKYDKFACFRDFFEKLNKNIFKARYPSPYLAIDEVLYLYRGMSISNDTIRRNQQNMKCFIVLSVTCYIHILHYHVLPSLKI